jgi:hypothetical protein
MSTQPTNVPVVPEAIDLTAADYTSCLSDVQKAVNAAFPSWTDFNRAAIGNVILGAFCRNLDIALKYVNDQARECRTGTVRRRVNMSGIARGYGIRLKGIQAASVDLDFSIPAAIANDVVIAPATQVNSKGLDDVIKFFTVAEGRITAGGTSVTISAKNSETRTETLTSDGTAIQPIRMRFPGYVDQSAALVIQGDTWLRVDNFFQSGPTDKHFVIVVDEKDVGFFVFGSGVQGAIPPQGDMTATYETGGGSGGNISANTIKQLQSSFFDTAGNAVSLTVTNAENSAGGSDRESVEQARRRLPGAIRVNQRTCAHEDFEIEARNVAGVARSMLLTRTEDPLVAVNAGDLIIIPTGDPAAAPSATLKGQVLARVTLVVPPVVTFAVTMVDPTFVDIAVDCTVKRKNGFTEAEVTANIEAAVTAFFALEDSDGVPNADIDFGGNKLDAVIPFSDVFNAVRDAAGVDRVDRDSFLPAADTTLALRDFPREGTVTVNFL